MPKAIARAECENEKGEVRVLWEKFANGTEVCYFYRDPAGFCLLTNRCWAGKSCPKTPGWADRYRDQLIDENAKERDERP